eukprot:CAMPEP_0174336840 /NCGR_PEP_ID=MMETSP0810-20121108/21844_1 /TAXON_ID=73025 ORGANISM="Eutreptiella gymnastica-like, Strain CCMP1594" /NCGR_SAMPLE_ID=MMETSP0810 /ASSEMBLY_ACC=CAM_ASM_000659 /LENGTH=184 /DNA_ID=CAMNT_0015455939 /DNA_START=336 /DNA_END=890 /DNA_ORIENTATION=-
MAGEQLSIALIVQELGNSVHVLSHKFDHLVKLLLIVHPNNRRAQKCTVHGSDTVMFIILGVFQRLAAAQQRVTHPIMMQADDLKPAPNLNERVHQRLAGHFHGTVRSLDQIFCITVAQKQLQGHRQPVLCAKRCNAAGVILGTVLFTDALPQENTVLNAVLVFLRQDGFEGLHHHQSWFHVRGA